MWRTGTVASEFLGGFLHHPWCLRIHKIPEHRNGYDSNSSESTGWQPSQPTPISGRKVAGVWHLRARVACVRDRIYIAVRFRCSQLSLYLGGSSGRVVSFSKPVIFHIECRPRVMHPYTGCPSRKNHRRPTRQTFVLSRGMVHSGIESRWTSVRSWSSQHFCRIGRTSSKYLAYTSGAELSEPFGSGTIDLQACSPSTTARLPPMRGSASFSRV
jgi:hypothetical protein